MCIRDSLRRSPQTKESGTLSGAASQLRSRPAELAGQRTLILVCRSKWMATSAPELKKSSMGQRSNQSNFWTSEFGQKFSQNSGNFVRIHQKFRNLRICQHFLNYSSKFREILIEIWCKIRWTLLKKSRFLHKFQQKYEQVWQTFAKILSFERCKGVRIL